ncbi:hypothetical protein [Haliscomenobacter hydrossis]|uniref:Uncharacterized protein n=1 Tax=Haliscomenobacter hydrossis (strain ATCC 27775 / DSM 1100 / LMG 10767 / O) TaxID=760192 RepID=F4KVP5_HALH1|nr:hypothetical protein [Haliscomenobacter hydrossis]AEE52502.1 hypothetical protein Halhy_4667 [Haliscomenobacter hydrossis DSM 1100]
MIGLIQVVIGLVFLLLLLSLLVTTIMELISSMLALRGQNLEKAIRNMLASGQEKGELFQGFKDNALYKQLCNYRGDAKQRPPSYISAENFQSILMDIILKGEDAGKLMQRIDELPNEDLKKVLKQLLNDAGYELEVFKAKIRGWFDDVMDRAAGWFKRNIQIMVTFVGLIVAVIFNADTISIYQRLESNPEELKEIVTMAEAYAQKSDIEVQTGGTVEEQWQQVNRLIDDEISQAKSPLGLGWHPEELQSMEPSDWVIKVLGWIVTALAVSLGAPFWFDLLKKLVNIRSAGNQPK